MSDDFDVEKVDVDQQMAILRDLQRRQEKRALEEAKEFSRQAKRRKQDLREESERAQRDQLERRLALAEEKHQDVMKVLGLVRRDVQGVRDHQHGQDRAANRRHAMASGNEELTTQVAIREFLPQLLYSLLPYESDNEHRNRLQNHFNGINPMSPSMLKDVLSRVFDEKSRLSTLRLFAPSVIEAAASIRSIMKKPSGAVVRVDDNNIRFTDMLLKTLIDDLRGFSSMLERGESRTRKRARLLVPQEELAVESIGFLQDSVQNVFKGGVAQCSNNLGLEAKDCKMIQQFVRELPGRLPPQSLLLEVEAPRRKRKRKPDQLLLKYLFI